MPLYATREDILSLTIMQSRTSQKLCREKYVCPSTMTEPSLQPLGGEGLNLLSANRDQEARLDIKASGF